MAGASRRQFGIGIALVFMIPVLVLAYFLAHGIVAGIAWRIGVFACVCLAALAGFLVLRKYPLAIEQLRTHLEHVIHGRLPEHVCLAKGEANIETIERCVNRIIADLRTKLHVAELERARLEEKLIQAKKSESLCVMAGGIAHDFNNIFSAIMGNAGIALRGLPNESPARMNMAQVESTARRGADLTNQLLICCGRSGFTDKPVDVAALVSGMTELISRSFSNGIAVEYDISDNLPLVTGDEALIRQAVMNLALNASEAIVGGKGTVRVSTGAMECDKAALEQMSSAENTREGQYVYVEVCDTGKGISPEIQEKMFDPFFTTKMRGQGLGLAVVLGVMRAHYGAISAESVPGKGSTFRILFPSMKQHAA